VLPTALGERVRSWSRGSLVGCLMPVSPRWLRHPRTRAATWWLECIHDPTTATSNASSVRPTRSSRRRSSTGSTIVLPCSSATLPAVYPSQRAARRSAPGLLPPTHIGGRGCCFGPAGDPRDARRPRPIKAIPLDRAAIPVRGHMKHRRHANTLALRVPPERRRPRHA
jgi:hypothetical protein